MNTIIGLAEFIIGAIVILIALILILLAVVSRMPADNPLRQVLNLLIARIGATAAAGPLPFPSSRFPASTYFTSARRYFWMYYWYTFFGRTVSIWSRSPSGQAAARSDHRT